LKKLVKFEFNRGIKSKGFLTSLIIGCVIVIVDIICFVEYDAVKLNKENMSSVIESWIGTDWKFAYNSLFYVLLPILAALPFAASYYEDLQSGYIKNICIKTSRKVYYISKYISVFILAAVTVAIPLLLNFCICISLYPMLLPEQLIATALSVPDTGFMSKMCNLHPEAYMLIYTFIDALYGGIIAIFSVCIAELVSSRFSAIVTPFTVYILGGVMLADVNDNWSLLEMLNPLQMYDAQGWKIGLIAVVGFIVSIAWITIKGVRKDVL
jgi:uncharacterized membrane protein (Fun14 family)